MSHRSKLNLLWPALAATAALMRALEMILLSFWRSGSRQRKEAQAPLRTASAPSSARAAATFEEVSK